MRIVSPLFLLLLLGVLALGPAAADEAAWGALAEARAGLGEAPLVANFVQTYTPAGFSTGDEESGRLYLALPRCLRWDYEDPYPRSYLICDQTVWAWSPGEEVGDRFLSVSREEAGLDFLLLSVERLRKRYAARWVADEPAEGATERRGEGPAEEAAEGGSGRVELAPLGDEAPFASAAIELEGESRTPVSLEYSDREGNTTRFVLSLYRDLGDDTVFLPPDGVEWIDG